MSGKGKRIHILDSEENRFFWEQVVRHPILEAKLEPQPRNNSVEVFCHRAQQDFTGINLQPNLIVINLELANYAEGLAAIEALETFYLQQSHGAKLAFAVWDAAILATSEEARMAARVSNIKDIMIADMASESVDRTARRIRDILDGNDQNPAYRSRPRPGQGPDGMEAGVPKNPYPPVPAGSEKQGIPVIK